MQTMADYDRRIAVASTDAQCHSVEKCRAKSIFFASRKFAILRSERLPKIFCAT